MDQSESPQVTSQFRSGQRVHSVGDPRRIGTVRYVGPVEGYPGIWIGVDWDDGEAKHDGSINAARYFCAKSEKSGSFVRPFNLTSGISLLDGLVLRYRAESEIEDEMYVLSASNRRVSVQFLGKDRIQEKLSHFEELERASLPYLGVNTVCGSASIINIIPKLKELDLTGNLLSEWKEVGAICKDLPALFALNLSNNAMSHDINELPPLNHIRILVLNNTGIKWMQVEILKSFLPVIEELHLMGNEISTIMPTTSSSVQGFECLRLLNLEDNCISEWDQILNLFHLPSLERLHLNNNKLNCICYPGKGMSDKYFSGHVSPQNTGWPFQNLRRLLLGGNDIVDVASIDSLNYFPMLTDVRLCKNPITDPGKGGLPRYVLIARLAKVVILNGSQVSSRERKESEIRYVRLIMSTLHDDPEEIKLSHPRFIELKDFHGIQDEKHMTRGQVPQKMALGLVSVNLKCVEASIGERPPLTKKLPATTMVGKLKILCESFFKFGGMRAKLYLEDEGSPVPILVDDELATLAELGIGNQSTILVDAER